MPRVARIVVAGVPHHVTQRGNNRQDVFFVDADRRVYLGLLGDEANRAGLRVVGYCLMTNHVHVVAIPRTEEALARALGRAHFRYTQYVNRLHGRSGHLWQNRFFSCPLDERHCWQALCYVERNPVRAGMVRRAWRYGWSSAAAHVGQRRWAEDSTLLDKRFWSKTWNSGSWMEMLLEGQDEDEEALIRRRTHTGRPLGTDRFVAKLERRLGRRLQALPVGRPKKPRRTQTPATQKSQRR